MKKFLLSSVFAILTIGAYAQICAETIFRENGGGAFCKDFTTATGRLRLTFSAPQNPLLQVYRVLQQGTLAEAEVVAESKDESQGGTTIRWCFKTDNIQQFKDITVQLYLDNGAGANTDNGIKDADEPLFNCTPEGTLPVTLVNFNAAQRSSKVTLTWNTLFESNNDGFEIERRIGGGSYQKIAFVDSKAPGGNGAEFAYSFEDNTVLPKGVSYYRLRQVDFDGRATYSEIKAVRTGNGAIILSVYPNPSRGTTNVALPAGVGTYDVSVDDFTGKSVQRFSGLTTNNLQLNNLKPGMYMLRVSIRATGETITERIAVQ